MRWHRVLELTLHKRLYLLGSNPQQQLLELGLGSGFVICVTHREVYGDSMSQWSTTRCSVVFKKEEKNLTYMIQALQHSYFV